MTLEVVKLAEPPVINEVWELREKMQFCIYTSDQNSRFSPEFIVTWGIKIDGAFIWRNFVTTKTSEMSSYPTIDQMRTIAVLGTKSWLEGIANRLGDFLEPH